MRFFMKEFTCNKAAGSQVSTILKLELHQMYFARNYLETTFSSNFV